MEVIKAWTSKNSTVISKSYMLNFNRWILQMPLSKKLFRAWRGTLKTYWGNRVTNRTTIAV